MSERLLIELSKKGRKAYCFPALDLPRGFEEALPSLPPQYLRLESAKLPEVSELDVVRHFTRLSNLAYGVDDGIYPLGSCTMKYNPKLSESLAKLSEFTCMHPLQDSSTIQGCLSLMYNLLEDLSSITGMNWGTLQGCAGAHGEYTGLKIIRAFFLTKGETQRNIVLVPESAHGTNPASAAMNGYNVEVIKSNAQGLVDLDDLKEKLNERVAAVMLTNPNTLGLFEKDILSIGALVHENGAKLYYDGANLNAIMGMATVGDMGFDVLHLNLHKTFATPHGGGGPGSGPVMVTEELRPFLPRPDIRLTDSGYVFDWDQNLSIGKISMFWGNFLVLVKAYVYILRMGSEGLRAASCHATLNANYLLSRLKGTFEIPYGPRCKHEFVVSCQDLKEKYGISALDISKALIERGYHPPTMYFPSLVHEALMFEPTESESVETLDKLADTIIEIVKKGIKDPDWIHGCPHNTVVGRLDEIKAVKEPNFRYI
ncbi:MAG: aminomethyl-transferring glycine dehydrogenase subunit GcvPB [Sphaerochaetaceae bacterium]